VFFSKNVYLILNQEISETKADNYAIIIVFVLIIQGVS
jgi:hypothetical protein